jgi:hypothetical protein
VYFIAAVVDGRIPTSAELLVPTKKKLKDGELTMVWSGLHLDLDTPCENLLELLGVYRQV